MDLKYQISYKHDRRIETYEEKSADNLRWTGIQASGREKI